MVDLKTEIKLNSGENQDSRLWQEQCDCCTEGYCLMLETDSTLVLLWGSQPLASPSWGGGGAVHEGSIPFGVLNPFRIIRELPASSFPTSKLLFPEPSHSLAHPPPARSLCSAQKSPYSLLDPSVSEDLRSPMAVTRKKFCMGSSSPVPIVSYSKHLPPFKSLQGLPWKSNG